DHVVQASEEIDLIERHGDVAPATVSQSGLDKKELEADIETFDALGSPDLDYAPGEDFGVVDDDAIAKELESVKFYVDSGYSDLAETALNELSASYGPRPEIEALRAALGQTAVTSIPADSDPEPKKKSAKKKKTKEAAVVETIAAPAAKKLDLDEIRIEFGVEEADDAGLDSNDYDTHYQLGVAYQEMGLMEDAIKEFQDAIGQIGENDKSRRFFQCAHLLGHCFMQKGMAKLALKWFNRALDIPGLNADEKKGIWYELAEAHEVDGDSDNAARYFEQVYAEDVDFRDVGNRLQNLTVHA
ncbi:MAG: tetratricopeptide repeat protein, partial [Pyrinomonadaceae bacterium]